MPPRPVEPPGARHLTRRRSLGLIGAGLALALAGCRDDGAWHASDVHGAFDDLDFTMTRASDGATVTEAAYRGRIALVYFGYTFCPDICPTTLANAARAIDALGADAGDVAFLFVTVDPARDTLPVLKEYVAGFGPQFDALRGTPDQIAALARRYRAAASVDPGDADHPYTVVHSSAVYVFDRTGAARLLITTLSSPEPGVSATTDDLRKLIREPASPGFLDRLRGLV